MSFVVVWMLQALQVKRAWARTVMGWVTSREVLVTSTIVMGSGGPIAIKSGHAPYSSGISTRTPCKAVRQTLIWKHYVNTPSLWLIMTISYLSRMVASMKVSRQWVVATLWSLNECPNSKSWSILQLEVSLHTVVGTLPWRPYARECPCFVGLSLVIKCFVGLSLLALTTTSL